MRDVLVRLMKWFVSKPHLLPPWLCPSSEHLRHSSLLGPASTVSNPLDENIFGVILLANLQGWRSGAIPTPSRVSTYESDRSSLSAISEQKTLKLSICYPRYRPNNGTESELLVHLSGSATRAGHIVSQFDIGDISYDEIIKRRMNYGKIVKSGVVALKEFLLFERPDIVVFDGNFMPNGKSITREMIREIKRDFGFKLCTIVGDLHDLQPQSRLDYWGEVSDLVVVFNSQTQHYANFIDKKKVLVAPFIPFDEHRFNRGAERDIGLGFCGGKGRRRDAFLSFADQCGIPTTTHFVDDKNYLTDGEFRDFLTRSQITFSNGYMGTIDGMPHSAMTQRIAESILSRSLLVYESGSQIDDYLVPFVHYIPVDNVHDLVHSCRYLLNHEEKRAEMANEAYSFLTEHYSSKKFWDCVTRRLCNVVAP